MEGKKLFIISFVTGLVFFSLFLIAFAISHSEIFDFIEYFIGI